MDAEGRRILILIAILNCLTLVQMYEYDTHKDTLPLEECDLIHVSHTAINKGIQQSLNQDTWLIIFLQISGDQP